MTTNAKAITVSMVGGLKRLLGLNDSQVKAAIQRYSGSYPAWHGMPHILVIPGADNPYGGGEGAQEGGDLLRRLQLSVVVYHRSLLDRVGESEAVLLRDDSILDWCEKVMGVFRYTFLADATYDVNKGLLFEPLFYTGQSETAWEDEQNGIFRRELYYVAAYEMQTAEAPGGISLITAQTQ